MKISTSEDLDQAIAELERRRVIQETILKEQFHQTVEHFKPMNLIKSAFHNITQPSPGGGGAGPTILKAIMGYGLGILTKKLVLGKTHTFVGKLASNGIKLGITNTVLNNTEKISAWGRAIYNNLFSGKSKKTTNYPGTPPQTFPNAN